MDTTLDERLDLPAELLGDDNHPEKIRLPEGFAEMPISSAPQYSLYRLVKYLKPSSVLEIGTQAGCSAFTMALAFRDNGEEVDITCVDPFYRTGDNDGLATLTEWYDNIYGSGFKGGIQLLISTSEQMLPQINRRFDFVFVDGNHEYENVRRDCLLALTLLKDGGYFLVHDYVIYESVRRGVDEVVQCFSLPFAVNEEQMNHRGDLCGWAIARRIKSISRKELNDRLGGNVGNRGMRSRCRQFWDMCRGR